MLRTYEEIYNKILLVMQQIEESERTTKAGRKPKISHAQIATLFSSQPKQSKDAKDKKVCWKSLLWQEKEKTIQP